MTFDEALRIAQTIHEHYSRLDVLAVGRFISPDEIGRQPERWGVSVRIDGGPKSRVLWSHGELLAYATPRPEQKATPRRSMPKVEETREPLLF